MSADYLGMRPLLKYMMILNTFHLPTGFEYRIGDPGQQQFRNVFGGDLHPDFDFTARYTSMEPALGKQHRAQMLTQLASQFIASPWINQGQYIKLIHELHDVRETDALIKSPQQFAQEQQQGAKAQMMAEQMKQKFETEGKLQKGAQDIGGKLLLEDRDHVHNMALETLKAELDTEATT